MEDNVERVGPPAQVRSNQTNSTLGGAGVGFTIQYIQEFRSDASIQ